MMKLSTIFKVHPITFIYFFIALQLGFFKNYLIIFLIVIMHELCHLLMAYFFDFKLGKMTLLPFGANLEIIYFGHYHVLKELMVSLMGPLSHIIIAAFLLLIKSWLGEYSFHFAWQFNEMMFLFNLIPLYPLDGSKILLVILSYIFPYRLTLWLNGIISLCTFLLISYVFISTSTIFILIYLGGMQIYYLYHVVGIYQRFVMYRHRFSQYRRIRFNKGYSLYRPYVNIYLKKED